MDSVADVQPAEVLQPLPTTCILCEVCPASAFEVISRATN
jgi:hypothetical protein